MPPSNSMALIFASVRAFCIPLSPWPKFRLYVSLRVGITVRCWSPNVAACEAPVEHVRIKSD